MGRAAAANTLTKGHISLLTERVTLMLDKKKGRVETCRNTPKESRMPQTAKDTYESEVEYIVRRIATDQKVRESLKRSLADSQNGRVVSSAEAVKRLKKKAS